MLAADLIDQKSDRDFARVKRWIEKCGVDPEFVAEIESLGGKRYMFRALHWDEARGGHVLAGPGEAQMDEIEKIAPYRCPVWVEREEPSNGI